MKKRIAIYILIIGFTLYIFHILKYAFVTEDAFISFRYARNLAEGNGIVFNLDQKIESYTNFLWVIFLSIGEYLLPGHMILISQLLAVLSGIGVLLQIWRFLYNDVDMLEFLAIWGFLYLILHRNFAIWSTSGLETMFFSFCVTGGVITFIKTSCHTPKSYIIISIWFLLAALTRPEGVLFFGIAIMLYFYRFYSRKLDKKHFYKGFAWLIFPFGLVYGIYFIWRWRYYGLFLPNTFYLKASDGVGNLITEPFWQVSKIYFLTYFKEYSMTWLLPAIIAAISIKRKNHDVLRQNREIVVFLIIFLLYILYIGADYMEFRFLVPILPLTAILGGRGFTVMAKSLFLKREHSPPQSLSPIIVFWAIMCLALTGYTTIKDVPFYFFSKQFHIDTWESLSICHQEMKPIGVALNKYLPEEYIIGLGPMGIVPFYSKHTAIDNYGMMNLDVSLHQPRKRGVRPGHQKRIPIETLFDYGADVLLSEWPEMKPSPSTNPNVVSLEIKPNHWLWMRTNGRAMEIANRMKKRGAKVHVADKNSKLINNELLNHN